MRSRPGPVLASGRARPSPGLGCGPSPASPRPVNRFRPPGAGHSAALTRGRSGDESLRRAPGPARLRLDQMGPLRWPRHPPMGGGTWISPPCRPFWRPCGAASTTASCYPKGRAVPGRRRRRLSCRPLRLARRSRLAGLAARRRPRPQRRLAAPRATSWCRPRSIRGCAALFRPAPADRRSRRPTDGAWRLDLDAPGRSADAANPAAPPPRHPHNPVAGLVLSGTRRPRRLRQAGAARTRRLL